MSPKHGLSPTGADAPDPKRPRVDVEMSDDAPVDATIAPDGELEAREWDEDNETPAISSLAPTQHSSARCGIQRSIALVLKHDGFESATPEAMESFTQMVETCLSTAAH